MQPPRESDATIVRASAIQSPPTHWDQEFQVHSYEVDFRRTATLETLCRYFLEAAWNHAEALGFGFSHLATQGKLWVLSRLLLRVEHYPAWGETVKVRTWPRAAKSIFAMRDFQLFNHEGERAASGTSAWLVLDAQTRRPQRVEKLLSTINALPHERATQLDPDKLPEPAAGQIGRPITVHYSDVDVNSHTNSCRYLGWVLDSYALAFHAEYAVTQLEINYLGETREGDELTLLKDTQDRTTHLHRLQRLQDQHEVCRTRVHWRECTTTESPFQ
jgi:medium-chain acyl-[acyl-carrier-protein] hydrolase